MALNTWLAACTRDGCNQPCTQAYFLLPSSSFFVQDLWSPSQPTCWPCIKLGHPCCKLKNWCWALSASCWPFDCSLQPGLTCTECDCAGFLLQYLFLLSGGKECCPSCAHKIAISLFFLFWAVVPAFLALRFCLASSNQAFPCSAFCSACLACVSAAAAHLLCIALLLLSA